MEGAGSGEDPHMAFCAGNGGVEPAEVVGGEHVFSHVALVDEDVGPLPALCFVAGDGIGVLDLHDAVADAPFDADHLVARNARVQQVLQERVQLDDAEGAFAHRD